jgi:phage gp46-like protein
MGRILFDSFDTPPTIAGSPPIGTVGDAAGDLALLWSDAVGSADVELIDFDADLATDRGLMTAVVLSLFTDRRAEADDVPPSGDARDRRGWWADQFARIGGDFIGSRLWLLDRSTLKNETALRAAEYVRESLKWMVDDRIVEATDVVCTLAQTGILIALSLSRPGRDATTFRFAYTWDHLQELL